MSYEGLEDAIQDVLGKALAETGGGFVTGFTLLAEVVDADGDNAWLYATAEQQRPIVTLGQIEWAKRVVIGECREAFNED